MISAMSLIFENTIVSHPFQSYEYKDLSARLGDWKSKFDEKGLRVNVDKTKVMISGRNLNTLKKSGKFPCGVCFSGVGSNSIFCTSCSCWVHKKCTNIRGPLKDTGNFTCSRCSGLARAVDIQPFSNVTLDGEDVEVN